MDSPTVDLLVRKRDLCKGDVETIVEFIEASTNLTKTGFSSQQERILEKLDVIDSLNEQIVNGYIASDMKDVADRHHKTETLFHAKITAFLGETVEKFGENAPPSTSVKTSFLDSHYNVTPKLKCPFFDPASLDNDKLAYLNFYREFENCVLSVGSKSLMLVVLKNHLRGYAYQIVSHLSISDANFDTAVEILDREFLDKKYIVNYIFKSLSDTKPLKDSGGDSVKIFLTGIKAQIYELRNSFELDFLEEGTPGNQLLSCIIFDKLPALFRREIIRLVGHNYPSLSDILDNYSDVIRTLEITRTGPSFPVRPVVKQRPFSTKFKPNSINKKPSTLENFFVKPEPVQYKCNFCRCNTHAAYYCNKYALLKDRLQHCKAVKLCVRCTSPAHVSESCPGNKGRLRPCWKCQSCEHAGALCPDMGKAQLSANPCLQMGDANLLLPIIEIKLACGEVEKTVNCLVDSGSQRSYLSDGVLDILNCRSVTMKRKNFTIKTFLGSAQRSLHELDLCVKLPSSECSVAFLVDKGLDLQFHISGLNAAVENMRACGLKLAADLSCVRNDSIAVHGLIGVDLLKYMGPMHLTPCMNGSAFEFPQGLVPFGDVADFMMPVEEGATVSGINYSQVVSEYAQCPVTHVYFVLDPKSKYFDPLDSFSESSVERSIDKLFSLETLGIVEDSVSDYDRDKIALFRDSISYRNNCYYVNLPWDEDKLPLVPSNHQVALKVLDRVVTRLTKQDLYEDYCQVFLEQEKEDIIERVRVDPEDFIHYTWIPHRPVVKADGLSTTKIRPVFNCSLRTGGRPSLNDCVYPGINLFTDMLDLLLKFRMDRYVLLADVRKAFLMIRLETERDKNRFCFFVKFNNELVCYRYKTLIFGFIASPFILNFVIKHHVEKYPPSLCREMLLNNFYVDNLVKTHASPKVLLDLYQDARRIMQEGNFSLRSCNSNSEDLTACMKMDGSFVSHGSPVEKVLGYLYDPGQDDLRVAINSDETAADTKRGILSQNSSIFDPLGLCLPLTIKGRILLSEIWKTQLTWDQKVPLDLQNTWNRLYQDLTLLHSLRFTRCVIDSSAPASLLIFCDASQQAFGFAAYVFQYGSAKLIFSKAKVAPLVKRTLPSLELLSVFLAMKCIPNILKVFPRKVVKEIVVAVDAQVVLSWILSENVKTKSIFTRNRLRDVREGIGRLTEQGFSLVFKYVNTLDNPADLITRGITLDKFKSQMQFWLTGPSWLAGENISWPVNALNCLSSDNQMMVLTNTTTNSPVIQDVTPVMNFERFSSLARLLRVLSYVVRFVLKLRKSVAEPELEARTYLLRLIQSTCLSQEKSFLLNPSNHGIPNLVARLDLYLDDRGLIRSRGRIGKSSFYPPEILHPILLPRYSHVTNLIILDCHVKCKHLGIAATLSKLRLSGFWIHRSRQAVKTVISTCTLCKRYNAISFKYPKVTNLPKHRVNFVRPFLHTGIDFTGHLWVGEGREAKKMYILLFTCFNVRALHLELVNDMSTHSVVLALIRFFNIYGVPSHIYSDNAKSFVSGCNLIKQVFVADEFEERFSTFNIKHFTIPLYSAWFGSVWERLIKTVKCCLFKLVGRQRLSYFELLSVLSDVQNAINSRPLTYRCSGDANLEIISPNAFIRPHYNSSIFLEPSVSLFEGPFPSRSDLLENLAHRDTLLEKFKSLWHEEYLLGLRELTRDLYQTDFDDVLAVDDVVLIKNPAKSRPFWSMGRVIQVTPGDDSHVRSALIRKADGSSQEHSLKHLFPLELAITHSHRTLQPPEEGSDLRDHPEIMDNAIVEETGSTSSSRPHRTRKRISERNEDYLWY